MMGGRRRVRSKVIIVNCDMKDIRLLNHHGHQLRARRRGLLLAEWSKTVAGLREKGKKIHLSLVGQAFF